MQQEFSRSFDQLNDIVAFTEQVFTDQGIDPSTRYVVDLCVEELFVNMVTYDTETDRDILIEMNACPGGVEVSLTDYGVERFDPRNAGTVDVDAPLEQRTPGGLGLFLVLKMVDSIHYEYRDRNSKITFVARSKEETEEHNVSD
ncbi:MAG: ATP-binding protein [Xanthomonadales bacterium]|nr:ATP-binding protein [Xanthomonadales bacterium]